MRMRFEYNSAIQAGEEVDRSQGAARAISVRIHLFTGDDRRSEQNLPTVVHRPFSILEGYSLVPEYHEE